MNAAFVLGLRGVSLSFGGLRAVSNLDLDLEPGQIAGLIGPNGAGKTTVFNIVTGVYPPDEGEVSFGGRSLLGLKPSEIAGLGLTRTFQNIRLFKDLSVLDNVRVAFHRRHRYGLWEGILQSHRYWEEEEAGSADSRKLLEIFGLEERAGERAANLPYGEQRKLEIVRALATKPSVLLLDEPAAGMNAQETAGLLCLIRRIRDEFSLGVLLIEHDMSLVMEVSERVTVLDHGVTIARGTPAEIRKNPTVIEAYLGAADG